MNEQEKDILLAKEEEFYISCESMLRSLIGRPNLTKYEIESHMKLCRLFLDEYLDKYKSIYHPDSPFALRFKEENNSEFVDRRIG